ncbi:hypothetical protein [Enhygromyxa salina]|uniref:Uncharacterized protein n=1 Tax=Enhygromyxa salina TaxID=215803 RepID=A0A2S9XS68_9BACT|nr:hypothetical protein [Enhygromyxa salina]PRP95707.1 hypothetical protein ENSA7_73410 [Enhygromyxa salina]
MFPEKSSKMWKKLSSETQASIMKHLGSEGYIQDTLGAFDG